MGWRVSFESIAVWHRWRASVFVGLCMSGMHECGGGKERTERVVTRRARLVALGAGREREEEYTAGGRVL